MSKHTTLFFVFILGFFVLSGCTPQAHKLMPAVQYNDSISFRVPHKAYLYWDSGEYYAHETPVSSPSGAGLLGNSIALMIDSHDRKNNPSKYHYSYGSSQQVIFMTSLKDILQENRVFEDIEIITDLRLIKPDDVLIKINFELTRVLANTNIILDVRMNIQHDRQQFERHYFIQNDEKVSSFKEKQINVSNKLMKNIISGIKQWALQNK